MRRLFCTLLYPPCALVFALSVCFTVAFAVPASAQEASQASPAAPAPASAAAPKAESAPASAPVAAEPAPPPAAPAPASVPVAVEPASAPVAAEPASAAPTAPATVAAEPAPVAPVAAEPAAEAVAPAVPAEAVSAPVEPAPAESAPADGKMPWETVSGAEAGEPAETAAETPEPAPETEPVVEMFAETPAHYAEHGKTGKVREPRGQSDGGVFRLGVRAALGAGGLHKHKALVDERDRNRRAIIVKPAIAAGAGLAGAFAVGRVFSLAVEGQYSMYRAHGEFVQEAEGKDYRNLYSADVFLHTAELPVLARIHINPVYIEAGASPGANVYSQIYKGNEQYKPIPEYFACGAVFGFGFQIENVLVGVRGHYGFLEYDKNLTGYPWSARVSVTKYFLY